MHARLLAFGLLLGGLGLHCRGEDPPDPRALPVQAVLPTEAAAPLPADGPTSCPIYQDERCQAGTLEVCDIYDPSAATFVDAPDPLLRRVFLYDRWFDKYMSPRGLTAERVFTGAMPVDTPESEWSKLENYSRWAGEGDSAIWTGAALVSDIFRYANTRTEADYQRMEARTRALLLDFEVTKIPGYLSRYHFLQLPADGPRSDQLMLQHGDETTLSVDAMPIEDLTLEGLPEEYRVGVDDGAGGRVTGTAYWEGDVSIDQYTGPMTAFPLVFNLLRDEDLKARIAYQMTCYLKRLQRIEVINLKKNPEVSNELYNYFAGAGLNLDPDDFDLRSLDTLVWYIHPGVNRENVGTYDRTCPDRVSVTPTRVIDAASDDFLLDMLTLYTDLDRNRRPRENQIDHFYIVSLRGGDASHLMHLAAMAYYFTGEEHYRDFLFDELIGNLHALDVADTMMAFRNPDWCFRFYGDHITYGTHWQFIQMLGPSVLKDQLIDVMEREVWQKAMWNHHNAKADVMYASSVPAELATGHDAAVESLVAQLRDFGALGDVKDAPRRTYDIDPQWVLDNMPSNISVRCPTEEERKFCEDGVSLFGFQVDGSNIGYECDGRPRECALDDGRCAQGLASEGLPSSLRAYGDFIWQRSPFTIGDPRAVDGDKQSPGRDLTEPYWIARHYGYITEGKGQVLAWRPSGTCAD
ncbi:MAG: hypothetical protein KC933_07435 [Myxococcales bacterium]|nr:hypothetical protein [Myxococcales bacterium]MCB9648591.1 hypothetical protein [Deltaproteobacteria bacterium]